MIIELPEKNLSASNDLCIKIYYTWLIEYITGEDILDKHVGTQSDTFDIGVFPVQIHREYILEI